ncbi:hypothetical protein B5M09_007787 [Aphanomyces astaci]|uniref:N-acetyltransferase domain-containing protein n=2 Tax=Aphanomyces astaci TaxID=112090 RepID=A0A425DDM7_APHAT|nr:hypothetical protein B5M09_007787 [Aphanomyces astaci]
MTTRRTLLMYYDEDSQVFLLRDAEATVPHVGSTVPTVEESLPLSPAKTLLQLVHPWKCHVQDVVEITSPEDTKIQMPKSKKKRVHFKVESPKRNRNNTPPLSTDPKALARREAIDDVCSTSPRVESETLVRDVKTQDAPGFVERNPSTLPSSSSLVVFPTDEGSLRLAIDEPNKGALKIQPEGVLATDLDVIQSLLTALVDQVVASIAIPPAIEEPGLAIAMDILEAVLDRVFNPLSCQDRHRHPNSQPLPAATVNNQRVQKTLLKACTQPKAASPHLSPKKSLKKAHQNNQSTKSQSVLPPTNSNDSAAPETLMTLEIEGRWGPLVERLRRDPTIPRPLSQIEWCTGFVMGFHTVPQSARLVYSPPLERLDSDVYAIYSEDATMQFVPFLCRMPANDWKERRQTHRAMYHTTGTGAFFDVVEAESGDVIGTSGFRVVDVAAGSGEWGVVISSKYQRRGYCKEIHDACMAWALSQGVVTATARTWSSNARMVTLLEQYGYRFVETVENDTGTWRAYELHLPVTLKG